MRIDKYLASQGYGTRKEVKQLIRDHYVTVNGQLVLHADEQVNELEDVISVNGSDVSYEEFQYFLLNKPKGYISASKGSEPNVLDLIDEPYRDLFPCGRLDKDTTGVLLITNDGQLSHYLLSPKHHVEKEYEVIVDQKLKPELIECFKKGVTLEDEICKPAELTILSDSLAHVILSEGKYHQIKRMFAKYGYQVVELKRIRFKNLILDEDLDLGMYRRLSDNELKGLKQGFLEE